MAWISHLEKEPEETDLSGPGSLAWHRARQARGLSYTMGTGRGSGHIILGTSQVTSSGSQPKVSSGENLGPEKVGPQSKGCTLAVSTQQWHPLSHPPTCHSSWSQFFLSSFCPKVSLLSPCSGTAPTQAHLPRPLTGPTALPGSQTQHPSLSLGWAQRAGVEKRHSGHRGVGPRPTLALTDTCWQPEPTARSYAAAHLQTGSCLQTSRRTMGVQKSRLRAREGPAHSGTFTDTHRLAP